MAAAQAPFVAAGVVVLAWLTGETGKILGTSTWPVTYQVLGTLGGTFGLLNLVVITFYGGEPTLNRPRFWMSFFASSRLAASVRSSISAFSRARVASSSTVLVASRLASGQLTSDLNHASSETA